MVHGKALASVKKLHIEEGEGVLSELRPFEYIIWGSPILSRHTANLYRDSRDAPH